VSRGGSLGPVSLQGSLTTATTTPLSGSQVALGSTFFSLALPVSLGVYHVNNGGFVQESFLYYTAASVPGSYWSPMGLFSPTYQHYLAIGTWGPSQAMFLDSSSGGGSSFGFNSWGTSAIPSGTWVHQFIAVYLNRTFVGFNGVWYEALSSASNIRAIMSYPLINTAAVGGAPASYCNGVTSILYDEWRLTAGTRYINIAAIAQGAQSGTYTVPSTPLVDEGAVCGSVPAAVANGNVGACMGTASGVSCAPTCNSGFTAVSQYVCVAGLWTGAPSCSGESPCFPLCARSCSQEFCFVVLLSSFIFPWTGQL
jgi:hypothetical protein